MFTYFTSRIKVGSEGEGGYTGETVPLCFCLSFCVSTLCPEDIALTAQPFVTQSVPVLSEVPDYRCSRCGYVVVSSSFSGLSVCSQ